MLSAGLLEGVDVEFFPHVIIQRKPDNHSIETVHNRRYIKLSICAGYFRDVAEPLFVGRIGGEFLFQKVFALLCRRISPGQAIGSAFLLLCNAVFPANPAYSGITPCVALVVAKRQEYSSCAVVVAVFTVFTEDLPNQRQKSLVLVAFTLGFMPFPIALARNAKNFAHMA